MGSRFVPFDQKALKLKHLRVLGYGKERGRT